MLQNRQLDQNQKELENRIALLTQEIERLNTILETRKREIEDRKKQYSQLEVLLLQTRGFEDKYKESEQRINMLLLQIDELNKKYQVCLSLRFSLKRTSAPSPEQRLDITPGHWSLKVLALHTDFTSLPSS